MRQLYDELTEKVSKVNVGPRGTGLRTESYDRNVAESGGCGGIVSSLGAYKRLKELQRLEIA
jgi:hypothetical protein